MLDFKIASGRSNVPLANKIADYIGVDLTNVTIKNFSDGEIWVKYEENIRGVDLFIIQSTNPPADNLLELLLLIDAAKRASAKRVTAVIPYFAYARQDRKDQPRVSISAKLIANLITRAGADRVITIDLHSSQIQGFFDIPFDHLYASPVLIRRLFHLDLSNFVVAAPDIGAARTARAYAKRLNLDLILVDKRRPEHNVAEVVNIIGNPDGKNIIMVDDLIDTGTTFVECAEALKKHGALEIYGVCVHPVFSGNAYEKISNSTAITKMFVTDTIPLKQSLEKIEVVSVAELFAEAIIRTHDNRSISSLFEIER
ncbi:MAG: Ribose-phosphate pyrophosphokinase [Candidatus Kapaibacterium sp.]|nr:MAG: Ribose-phosphate pyrophosphokinase [Candidatus Kapabacteria bacterium]